MRRRILSLALLVELAGVASGQQSLFQTSDGQSSLYIQDSTAALNLGDSKASIGYTHRTNARKSWIEGYEVFATANKGVASLFSSDKAKAPEGGGDFTIGKHFLATNNEFPPDDPDCVEWVKNHRNLICPYKNIAVNREDWALLDFGYAYSQFLVSPTVVSASAAKTVFNRYRALLAYNYYWGGNIIGGVSGGVEHRNNTSDLTSAQFETVIAPAPVGGASDVVKTTTGFYGTYRAYVGVPIYTDLIWQPHGLKTPGFGNRVGIDFLTRSDVAAPRRSSLGGLGLFFFKKGSSTVPVGGVTGTYDGTTFRFSVVTGFVVSK